MPIITLYGNKGGTGRTTISAALTVGLLADGCDVTMVDTNPRLRTLEDWGEDFLGSGVANCRVGVGTDASALTALAEHISDDPNRFIVIDTPRERTDLRQMALEVADIILVPFGTCLDADVLVRHVVSDVPQDKHLIGLPTRDDDKVVALMKNWIRVLAAPLTQDIRLMLFSGNCDVFFEHILAGGSEADDKRMSGLEAALRSLVKDVKHDLKLLNESPNYFAPAAALVRPDASLNPRTAEAVA